MLIELLCKNKKIHCSFEEWDYYKGYLALKTIQYIQKVIDNYMLAQQKTKNNNHNEDSHYHEDLNVILNFFPKTYLENLDLKNKKDYELFYNKCINVFKNFNDVLIYFTIGGIHIILEKINYEGNLSIGNSLDIVTLLNKILANIERSSADFTDKLFILEFYDLCVLSVQEHEKIIIS